MDPRDTIESGRAIAKEIIDFGRQQGIDLEPIVEGDMFQTNGRSIFFWRIQTDHSAYRRGGIGFNMQGKIEILPKKFKESAEAFQERGGFWDEAGSVQSIEQAFVFLKAWLIDRKQVDELPTRKTRRCGI